MDGVEQILVTPEQLLQMADDWAGLINRAKESYKEMGEMAKRTKKYFRGKAAEVFEREFEKKIREGMEKVDSMQELTVKLTQIAEEYRCAEGENKDVFGRS